MAISMEQIKELRERTGVSVMQCKKALEEAGGDMEKAIVIMKQKSKDIASKKADRVFGAGTIAAYIHTSGTVGAMVELVAETDFVSKNDEFKVIARDIAMHIAASNPEYLKVSDIPEETKKTAGEAFTKDLEGKSENIKAQIMEGKLKAYFKDRTLLEQDFVKNPEITIAGLIDSAMQKFGEKIEVARFERFGVLER